MIQVAELQALAQEKVSLTSNYFLKRGKAEKVYIINERKKFLIKLNKIINYSNDRFTLELYKRIKDSENSYHQTFLNLDTKIKKEMNQKDIVNYIYKTIPSRDDFLSTINKFEKFKREQFESARELAIKESIDAERLFLITTILLLTLWGIISTIIFRSYAGLKKSEIQKIGALADLDESMIRFKDLVNHLDHSIVWEATTNPFKFNFISERSNIIFGIDSKNMLNNPELMFSHIHEEDVLKLKQSIQDASNSTKDIRCDVRVFLPQLGLRWIQTRVHCRRSHKGIQTLYGLSIDITLIKNNELNLQRALREVEQYKHALNSSSIVVTSDANGKIIKVNDQFCLVSKYTRDELIGTNYKILCHGIHPQNYYENMHETLKAGKIWRNESQIRTKDGTIFWVDAVIVPFMDEEGKPWRFMGILNDITTKKNASEEREKFISDLKLEKEARLKFVNTLTHDLRTPITAAKIAAQMIVMKKDDQEKVIELSYKIKNAINRTDNMIQDLLDADRIRAGQPLMLKTEYSELKSIISEAIEEQSLIHGNRFILKTNGPLFGYWDKMGIRRMADNLLSNAIKYGHPNGKIIVSIGKENEWATFSVFNKGEKLTQEEINSLFSHYHRLKKAIQGQISGWGIGLTLVKGIAEAHGGRVEVQTNQEGVTFKVYLKTVENHLAPDFPRDTISP